jgi:hypothetical protein
MGSTDGIGKNLDKREKRGIVTDIVTTTTKLIRYSKGGLDKDEKRELAGDLERILAKLAVDILD